MASSGEVATAIAEAFGLAAETALMHVRLLRQAGLLRLTGRGRSASDLSFVDTARVLVACCASDMVKDGVEEAREFFVLPGQLGGGNPDEYLRPRQLERHAPFNPTTSPTLGDAIAALIEASYRQALTPPLSFDGQRTANLRRPPRESGRPRPPRLSLTFTTIIPVGGGEVARIAMLSQGFDGGARAYRVFRSADVRERIRYRDIYMALDYGFPEGARTTSRTVYLPSFVRLGAALRELDRP